VEPPSGHWAAEEPLFRWTLADGLSQECAAAVLNGPEKLKTEQSTPERHYRQRTATAPQTTWANLCVPMTHTQSRASSRYAPRLAFKSVDNAVVATEHTALNGHET
jgi:hypothetical protein